MNWSLLFKYLGVIGPVLMALEAAASEIAAGAPASTPPISTYLEGHHVAITLNVTPSS